MAGTGASKDKGLSDADVTLSLVPHERRLVCIPIKQLDHRAIRTVEHGLKVPAARRRAWHRAAGRRGVRRVERELGALPGVIVVVLGVRAG